MRNTTSHTSANRRALFKSSSTNARISLYAEITNCPHPRTQRTASNLGVGEVSNAAWLNVFVDTPSTGRSGSTVVANDSRLRDTGGPAAKAGRAAFCSSYGPNAVVVILVTLCIAAAAGLF
jgi:hypothetical protein